MIVGPVYVEGGSYRCWRGRLVPDALHVWIGPIGLHLFWPDLWKSRPDIYPTWREAVVE